MNGTFHRRFWVLLGTATAAFFAYKHLPNTDVDRRAFAIAAQGFSNPPFIVTGNGSHSSPWNLRSFPISNKPKQTGAPAVVSLDDDRGGFFQNSPLSPIDLAVILTNFQRLGAKNSATAAVLAWDTPDPIGLMALDKSIRAFDSLVMAAPLTRGALPELMPPAFRNASVPLASVKNDCSLVPIVNRIPLPGVILGNENTLAGFQSLDSEQPSQSPPMIARWEDRVALAFPLLVALQHLGLSVDEMEIHCGEFIKLGPNGPIIPIDSYGRLTLPLVAVKPSAIIPAAALIDAGNDLFPKNTPVILRDDRSAAETNTREFSKTLVATISAITSNIGVARDYPRLQPGYEICILAAICLALSTLCCLPIFSRNIGLLCIAAVCIAAQCIAIGFASIWLPGLAAIAAVIAAVIIAPMITIKSLPTIVVSVPAIIEPVQQAIEPSVPPARETPRKVAAKKASPARKKKRS
ncbi:MAG: hypothetical protein H8M99_00920 [Gloeobacteraceae cyanobacterium ES-bin-144]|nr:hypothetical protein [Verrucomicrobiales bacterium]